MYVDASTVRRGNKTYTRYCCANPSRSRQGQTPHIANLSQCSAPEIEAIRLALTHKHTLTDLGSIHDAVQLRQGASVGAVALLYALAQQIGLTQALGPGREASLAFVAGDRAGDRSGLAPVGGTSCAPSRRAGAVGLGAL